MYESSFRRSMIYHDVLHSSLVPRPTAPILEAIKSWRCGRPENEATSRCTISCLASHSAIIVTVSIAIC